MYSVGLDVGDNCSSLEILDEHGKQFKHLEVKGRWPVMLQQLQKHTPGPFKICFEASCGYGHLYDKLSKIAHSVQVAHPGQLRLIFKSKRKHNRVDSQKLAKLLYLDEVPQAWVPPVDVRSWRAMIEHRQRLMRQRVSVKNQIRSLLKGLGIQSPRSLWSSKGMTWLSELELEEAEQMRRDIMIDQVKELTEKILQVQKYLKKIADGQPAVALLMTIPGVGIRTAEAFVAYVCDVKRFERIKRVGAYFGLVPCQDASGNFNRLEHITKDGPSTVRKMLTEAAWQGIRKSQTIRGFYERVRHDDPKRNKIAVIATAHYLVRVMTAMMRSGECWREKDQPAREQSSVQEQPSAQEQKKMKGTNTMTGTKTMTAADAAGGCVAPLRKTPDA